MLVNNFWKCNLFKRFKHKSAHRSVLKKGQTPCDKALEHFDEFYVQFFGKNWSAIRHGLLSKQKYVAVVNNFSDTDRIKTKLESEGALNIRTLFDLEKQYIKENIEKFKRKKYLEEIWKSDEQETYSNVIKKTEIKEQLITENVYQSQSLERNLLKADIDLTRVIPNNVPSVNLHDFMPVTKLKGREDWIAEPTQFDDKYDKHEFSVSMSNDYDIHFPENLNAYCYEIGNHNDFNSPRSGTTGVLDYYLMDGGSLLPILALDIKPGDKVLDMCAAPGGKSYLALQTLYPDKLVCNDLTKSRTDRINHVMKQYLYDFKEKWLNKGIVHISLCDGRNFMQEDFDKIIVDVPCTTDRHSLKESENNIFKAGRIKERLKLPELQCALLVQALKLVRIGGTVVYSTCSLSPIQNDGVIHLALKQIWEETNLKVIVKNMNPALLQTTSVYKLAEPKLMKYGQLVVPNLELNFGPTYFCKLQRIK